MGHVPWDEILQLRAQIADARLVLVELRNFAARVDLSPEKSGRLAALLANLERALTSAPSDDSSR